MGKREMKGMQLDNNPIGKRTRLQRALREKEAKELLERNKRARLAEYSRNRRARLAEYNQDSVDDSDDDFDDEDVKVVDEAEYNRRMCLLLEYRDYSPNVVVDEAEDSLQIVDRWNPLSVVIYNGCTDLGEEYQCLGVKPSSEARNGVGVDESCRDPREDNLSLEMKPISLARDDLCVEEGYCTGHREEYQYLEMKPSSEARDDVVVDKVCGDVREDCQSLELKASSEARDGVGDAVQSLPVQPRYGDCRDLGEGCHSSEMYPCLEGGGVVVGGDGKSLLLKPQNEGCGDLGQDSQSLEMSRGFEAGCGQSSPIKLHYEGCCDLGEVDHSPEIHPDVEGGCGDGASDGCVSAPMESVSVSEDDKYPVTSSSDDDHNKSSDIYFQVDDDHNKLSDEDFQVDDDNDKLSDEDFQVDETDISASSDASEDDDEWKEKGCNNKLSRVKVDRYYNRLKKTDDNTYDEKIQRGVNDNDLIESDEPEPKTEIDRKRGVLSKNKNVGTESEPMNIDDFVTVDKRGRGRPQKNSHEAINSTPQMKKRVRKLNIHEAENIMLNTILENGNTGLGSCIHSMAVNKTNTSLPLKFKFGVQNSLPLNSDKVQDSESLFQDLGFALRISDIGADIPFMDEENNNFNPCDSAVVQEQLCWEGKHYLIHDDEIGIRCKYCSFLKLEIRHVTPAFNENPFGRAANKNNGRFPSDKANATNGFHLPEFKDGLQNTHSDNSQATVWELIPGIKETLYPHQQEGFEFMWRNVGGGIKLNELGKPSKFGSGGCIICHAPGTGKTCLAITFLQSFIRQYPMSKPVIIAPKPILLTWEEEFARWNIDVPFFNINKNELSGKEDLEFLEHAENVKDHNTIRIAKIYTWAMGKGILGISYTLFETLAGDRKGVNEKIRQILIEYPGILVLDEGHTARNDQSNIWNVLTEVETKRRIILSGTPFQNNFEELLNTLSLVREEFGNSLLPGKYTKHGRNLSDRRRGLMVSNADNDRRIAKLKNGMKPFVHVHKGEILKKTLRGLFHSVILLKPSDLQKTCFQQLSRMKNGLKLDHLVSIASIHPSLLRSCEQIPDSLKDVLKNHGKNLDSGVKIRFLFDLINLAQDEKILVFCQFLKPLEFIGNLLKSHYHWTEENELLYMDGKQDVKQRQAFIRHFNNPKSEARVLLASTKACCEGIHLVGASRVVLLDVVWNPSVERQAISRAYRLGQKKDVFVYHLITSGTQEEEKYYWQVTKDRVSEKVFSSEEETKRNVGMSTQVSEDRILEEMIQNEKIKNMFAKIIDQPKADEMIDSFGPMNL